LSKLFDDFSTAVPLDYSKVEADCRREHDAFDALVCAVIARMVHGDLTCGPPSGAAEIARLEGWIHVPVDLPLTSVVPVLLGRKATSDFRRSVHTICSDQSRLIEPSTSS